ncbi:DUF4349 domain-containing protein [Lachnospiraceae bacterium 54-53]
MRKRHLGMVLLVLAALSLNACAGKSSSTGQNSRGDFAVSMDAGMEEAASAAVSPAAESEKGDASSITNGSGSSQVLPAGRKLIRNISMEVETDDFDGLIAGLQDKIAGLGGYVEKSDMSGNSLNSYGKPGPRHAGITARIPVDQLDSFITAVETGGNVTNKSESTQDITLQYSDLESKKKSLVMEQDKLWEFLEQAESVDTVITLQQRLSEIRYQLESMESQLRLYDNQVDYSTVELNISEVTIFTPTAPESALTRISKGFTENVKVFTTAMVNLMIGTITTIPFWLPLALVAGIIIFFLQKRRRKTPPALPLHGKDKETKDSAGS